MVFGPISVAAKAALSQAAEEASRRGDRRIGTDHLLLGLLHDPTVAGTLRMDAEHARSATQELDRAALAAVGINIDSMPESVAPRGVGHAPLTSGLRAVMARAVAIARGEHVRRAEPRHLLAALLERRSPDPAAALLEAMSGVEEGSAQDGRPAR